MGTAVGAAIALCACDDVFGLERHVDAAIDAPADSVGSPDAPADAAIDAPPDVALDAPVGPACPANYGTVDGTLPNKYRFITSLVPWTTAQSMCAADQIAGSTRFTHLAVIDDDPERSRLNSTQPMRTWVGLSDRVVEGSFRWVSAGGAILPMSGMPWATNEPDHASPADDCVEMNGVADYAESDCTALLKAWCECDANPIVPGTF